MDASARGCGGVGQTNEARTRQRRERKAFVASARPRMRNCTSGNDTGEFFSLLENAQHDRADEGERDIGGYNAHAAGESHATTPGSCRWFVVTRELATGSRRKAALLPSSVVHRGDMVKKD
jgi:hypothetical protein